MIWRRGMGISFINPSHITLPAFLNMYWAGVEITIHSEVTGNFAACMETDAFCGADVHHQNMLLYWLQPVTIIKPSWFIKDSWQRTWFSSIN
jgi:hypothetical protein